MELDLDPIIPRLRKGEPPGLLFLLDLIDCTEEVWSELPSPGPVIAEFLRSELMVALGFPLSTDET